MSEDMPRKSADSVVAYPSLICVNHACVTDLLNAARSASMRRRSEGSRLMR
jgi:hypothetical protein